MSSWKSLFALLLMVQQVIAAPGNSKGSASHAVLPEPDPTTFVNVTLGNKVFINKGLVGFGLIPSNFRESTGDTFGGVGSAIALKKGSWKQNKDGTFSGSLIVQPDRGFNIISTVDYQGRQHRVDFNLSPYYNSTPLSFTDAQSTLKLTYRSTLLYSEIGRKPFTGLDPIGIRKPKTIGLIKNPEEPIVNSTVDHITLDAEGLVLNNDGTFWVSDEYGPYLHLFSPTGTFVRSIEPPKAILPFQPDPVTGAPELNFTSLINPLTGRQGNQGFEGLTSNPSGTKLFVLLQSATMQDGGATKTTSRFTRLLIYDVGNILKTPKLIGEYVVPLPQKASNNNTFAQSDFHYLSDTQFLVLSRDGDGNGNGVGNEKSSYKQIDLFDISDATNIANTKFDDPANPAAPNGVLVAGITPAIYQSFINMLDKVQLGRFGLHNGKPLDSTLIDGKWESIALAPVGDPSFPDDYFVFTAADNDFQTTDGISVGQPYNAGADVDNQFLVLRATLPSIQRGSVEKCLGL